MSPGEGRFHVKKRTETIVTAPSAAITETILRADADRASLERHTRADQECSRRVKRHRVIFLSGRKREKQQNRRAPAECKQRGAPRAVDGPKVKADDVGNINTPRKEPDQVESPKEESGNGIVVSRISRIQEAKDLLVDEEKPEEPVVLSRPAVHREVQVRRIVESRENVPGSGNQQKQERAR